MKTKVIKLADKEYTPVSRSVRQPKPIIENVEESKPVESKSVPRQIPVARVAFTDSLTGKSYSPNDEICGWSDERIKHYLARDVLMLIPKIEPLEVK